MNCRSAKPIFYLIVMVFILLASIKSMGLLRHRIIWSWYILFDLLFSSSLPDYEATQNFNLKLDFGLLQIDDVSCLKMCEPPTKFFLPCWTKNIFYGNWNSFSSCLQKENQETEVVYFVMRFAQNLSSYCVKNSREIFSFKKLFVSWNLVFVGIYIITVYCMRLIYKITRGFRNLCLPLIIIWTNKKTQ
jgi:hypothetical protein